MRLRLGVFAGLAAGLVLLAVLVFRGEPEPGHGPGGRRDERPSTRTDTATPPTPRRTPDSAGDGVENDDHRGHAIPGTERWHYEKFLRLAAADPDGFDRLAAGTFSSDTPLQERIALLRAAWKVRGSEALPWFAAALADESGSAGDVRGFVVRHLASHARSAEVRAFLTKRVFLADSMGARERSAAGRAVLEAADPPEIQDLLAAMQRIHDVSVLEGALVGLGLNGHAEAEAALAWISRNHPDERVRARATEVSRQRAAGELGTDEEDD